MLLVLMLCLFVTSAFAGYTKTTNYSIGPNLPNCLAHNCYLPTSATSSGSISLTQISSGFDGYVLGVDANGNLWTLPMMSTATGKSLWAATGLPSVKGVAVYQKGVVYALSTVTTGCAAPNSKIEVLNAAGTGWTVGTKCFQTVSVGIDYTVAGIASTNGSIYYAMNVTGATPTWKLFGTTGFSDVRVYNATVAFGVKAGAVYQINLTTGAVTLLSSYAGTASKIAATSDGYLFVLNTSGAVSFYTFLQTTAPTWSSMSGMASNIFGGISAAMFTLDNSNSVYHVLAVAVSFTTKMSGFYPCPPATGCPLGSFHTLTAHSAFVGGYNATTSSSVGGSPESNLQVSHTDTSSGCDPIFGDPFSEECFASTSNGSVDCSVMGGIFSDDVIPIAPIEYEVANTGAIWTAATPASCVVLPVTKITQCSYPVNNNCTINTTPPDLNMNGGSIGDADYRQVATTLTWVVKSACYRLTEGTPWICGFGLASVQPIGAVVPYSCTYNP